MRLRGAALGLSFLLCAGVQAASKPTLEALETRLDGERVRVSLRVADAFDAETLERIHSGIPVAFRCQVDVVRPRGFPLFFDKRLGRTTVETEVVYNGLTRQYSLRRTVAIEGAVDAVPTDSARTAAIDAMMRWMTEFEELPVLLTRGLEAGPLRAEVDCSLGRRFVWYVFPGVIGASARDEVR